ncbi:MAG: metallophosphoesterase [Chloroflexi bacterium]|nr:metallophosphoesterase [Chloroflexota bacterium]
MIEAAPPPELSHGRRDPRFGLRVPDDGSPAPFRVLVSTRWLWAALAGFLTLSTALVRFPWRWRVPLVLSTAFAGVVAAITGILQARGLKFERVTIPVADLPPALDGFTIVQISDFHLGAPFTERNLERAISWTRIQQADLVVLTGDFINYMQDLPLLDACLQDLNARYGTYAILGNHDYWTNIQSIGEVLTKHGIELLRNEQRWVEVDGARLYLVGIDCVWESKHDPALALSNIPADATIVVLAHEPDIADEIAPYGAVLQLSGHTHAGHFAIPGLGPLFLPRHGFRYFRGLQRVGQMWLYVSRGLGGSPMRLGCTPEVTKLTLRRSDER